MNIVAWFIKGFIFIMVLMNASGNFTEHHIMHGFLGMVLGAYVFAMMIQDLKEEIQKER